LNPSIVNLDIRERHRRRIGWQAVGWPKWLIEQLLLENRIKFVLQKASQGDSTQPSLRITSKFDLYIALSLELNRPIIQRYLVDSFNGRRLFKGLVAAV
jgi:hypothetical protein